MVLLSSILAGVIESRSALPSLFVGRSGRVMLAGCPCLARVVSPLPGPECPVCTAGCTGVWWALPSVRWRHSVHLHHSSTPPSCHSDNSTATGSQGEKLSLITPWGRLGQDKATSSLVILSPPQYRSFQEDIPNCYSFVGFKDTFYMCSCRHTTTLHITMCRKSI